MDIVTLKILDLLNGVWASGALVYMFFRLSDKRRKISRGITVAISVFLFEFSLFNDLFLTLEVKSQIVRAFIIVFNMLLILAMIVVINNDGVKKIIKLYLLYLIPRIISNLILEQFMVLTFGDVKAVLANANVMSLFYIYSITLTVVFSVAIVLFYERKRIKGVWNFIFLLAMFPILGLSDLIFVLYTAPDKISIVNSIGASIQLFITTSIAFSMARFLKVNNELIEYEHEQEHLADLRDIDKRYYDLVSADVDYVRKFRHDIANYTEQIDYMITHRDEVSDEALGDVVNDLKDKVKSISRLKYCDDPYVNMILVLKDAKCKGLGIPYTAKANVAESPVMEPLDRSSLLSNLIDNAINSAAKCKEAGREASVSVSIGLLGDYIAVRTENDTMFDGEVNDIDTLVAMTKDKRKHDRDGEHGYGLTIIRETVAKYEGDIVVNIKDNKCVIVATIKVGEEGVIKNV